MMQFYWEFDFFLLSYIMNYVCVEYKIDFF